MAAFRCTLAALNYLKNVTPVVYVPNPKPLCIPSLLQPHSVIRHHGEICAECTAIEKVAKHHWNGTVMLLVGAPIGLDENIMRMSIREGVKQVANLDSDKVNGETLQHMLCHEFKDGNKVKYLNCDVRNEQQLVSRIQSVLRNKENSYVVVNNINFLNDCMSKKEVDSNRATFMNSSLTAFEMMRTDKDGKGGAIINMVAISPSSSNPCLTACNANRSVMDIILSSNLGLNHDRFFSKTGVRVMTICYGASDAHLTDDSKTEARRSPTAIEVLQSTEQIIKSAARALIDIYKVGENGTTLLSKETEPTEDITLITNKAYVTSPNPEGELEWECI